VDGVIDSVFRTPTGVHGSVPKEEQHMATGSISKMVRDRGFGFIKSADSADEVFFHRSSVEQDSFDELNEGQSVEFDVEADPKQPNRSRALNVRAGS
jgi:CspA family cold shock protein